MKCVCACVRVRVRERERAGESREREKTSSDNRIQQMNDWHCTEDGNHVAATGSWREKNMYSLTGWQVIACYSLSEIGCKEVYIIARTTSLQLFWSLAGCNS